MRYGASPCLFLSGILVSIATNLLSEIALGAGPGRLIWVAVGLGVLGGLALALLGVQLDRAEGAWQVTGYNDGRIAECWNAHHLARHFVLSTVVVLAFVISLVAAAVAARM
jgi:hypothetical protein